MCTCVRSIFKVTIILSPYYIICRCKYSVFHQNFQKNHPSVSCIKKKIIIFAGEQTIRNSELNKRIRRHQYRR